MSTDDPDQPPSDGPDHRRSGRSGDAPAGRGTASDGGPSNPPPPGDADVSELQVRVARAERAHAALEHTVAQIGPGLAAPRDAAGDGFATTHPAAHDALEARLGVITDTLEDHAASLRRVLARQQRNRNPAVDWPALTAEQAAAEWPRLAQWIDEVFVPWGEITRDALPDCWALHRPVVVQLSWLRSAHVQAYLPAAEPAVAGDWHIRWSPAVLAVIKTVIESKWCRPGEHMITVEESNARRRAAARANPTPPPPPTGGGGGAEQLGRMQLAECEYWQAFYLQAVDADLAWRTARHKQHLLDHPDEEPPPAEPNDPDLDPPPPDEQG